MGVCRAETACCICGDKPGLPPLTQTMPPAAFFSPMHPQAPSLWRGPRWALAILLAVLGKVGPFSIDTYLPAFAGITDALGATPVQMQQTLHPSRRGMASSLQMFVGSGANAITITAGVIAPFVMHSTLALATASVGLLAIGLFAWIVVRRRWPLIGRLEDTATTGRPRVSVGG